MQTAPIESSVYAGDFSLFRNANRIDKSECGNYVARVATVAALFFAAWYFFRIEIFPNEVNQHLDVTLSSNNVQ